MSSETSVVSFENTVQVALNVLEHLDTPRALTVFMLVNEFLPHNPDGFAEAYKELGFNPDWYLEADHKKVRFDYQASVLLSKLPSPSKNPLLRERAIASFREDESKNAKTNQLWWNCPSKVESDLYACGCNLTIVRSLIAKILGRAPSLRRLAQKGSWTTGSSVLFSRRNSDAPNKCEYGTSITYQLAKRIYSEGIEIPLVNIQVGLDLVPGNLGDTVPKDIKTDRLIFKEPEINMFFQREIGSEIKKRLQPWGIDLFDQKNNQMACMRAYIDRRATIDLKSASNSNCLAPIESVLPRDWFDLLEITRSPRGSFCDRNNRFNTDWHEYSMISSMGNGFTFELESLMFFAICVGCGCDPGEVYVYGDDIIIPQHKTHSVTEALNIFGFQVNEQKSFTRGTFYESCGAFSFIGIDITPFKIKDLISGNKERIVLANKLRETAHSSNFYSGCDRRFLLAWKMLLSGLSKHVRLSCRGPRGSGLLLFMNRNECPNLSYARRRNVRKPNYQLVYVEHLVPVIESKEGYHQGLSIHRQSEIGKTDRAAGNIVNQFPTGAFAARRLYLHINDWYDYGAWE